jgi:hypothetical protein
MTSQVEDLHAQSTHEVSIVQTQKRLNIEIIKRLVPGSVERMRVWRCLHGSKKWR